MASLMSVPCREGRHEQCRANAITCGCVHHATASNFERFDRHAKVPCEVCGKPQSQGAGMAAHLRMAHPANDAQVASNEKALEKHKPVIELEWADPPAPHARKSPVENARPLIIEIRRNPGRWARILRYRSKNSAATSAANFRKAFPDVEFRSVKTDDGSDLYARFVEDE